MTVLKYPGQKKSLAAWIIGHFPTGYQKMTYLEPFFGSGSVFFSKEPSLIETVNDKYREVFNLFLQIREHGEQLIFLLENTPWSRDDYLLAYDDAFEPLEQARRFLVQSWFSIGACVGRKNGMRMNIAGDNGGLDCFYRKLPEAIRETAKRLKHEQGHFVQIENRDALHLMERYNRENVFMYLDPPYVPETRKHKKIYAHEMSGAEHGLLLSFLKTSKAKILLSGYDNELYREALKDWQTARKFTTDEAGNRRTECLWANYEFQREHGLFREGGNVC
jgi:DNA adenine methylase